MGKNPVKDIARVKTFDTLKDGHLDYRHRALRLSLIDSALQPPGHAHYALTYWLHGRLDFGKEGYVALVFPKLSLS